MLFQHASIKPVLSDCMYIYDCMGKHIFACIYILYMLVYWCVMCACARVCGHKLLAISMSYNIVNVE